MKKILFYSTLIICTTFYSQDDWTLYPKKETLDSLNLESNELLKKIPTDYLCNVEAYNFHGDFILDNIIKTNVI